MPMNGIFNTWGNMRGISRGVMCSKTWTGDLHCTVRIFFQIALHVQENC